MYSRSPLRRALVPLAFAMCVLISSSFVLLAVPQAHASQEYGVLSAKYESGTDASYASYSAGAYGAWQLSKANAKAYATSLQAKSSKYASWGNALLAAYALDGDACGYYFDATWRYIAGGASATTGSAASDSVANATRITAVEAKMAKLGYAKQSNGSYIYTPSAAKALQYQYDYCIDTFYEPAVSYWEAAVSAFDADDYSVALQNVIFSTAIQHGAAGSRTVFSNAVSNNGGFSNIASEKKLIQAIYNERSRTTTSAPSSTSVKITKSALSSSNLAYAKTYGLLKSYLVYFSKNSANVQVSIFMRLYVNEKADALALLKEAADGSCAHAKTKGGVVTYSHITDKNHTESVTAVKCSTCGVTLEKAYTRTVANVYKRSGKKFKDVSGHSYTVHSKGWYKVTATVLNVRGKASTSSSIKTQLAFGKKVRVKASKMGSDGFWWGKVASGGKTGWVQMRYLSSLGTASVHSYSGGTCTYCALSKTAVSRMTKIRSAVSGKGKRVCTFTKAAKAYKNAYGVSKQAVKTYKKGAKVTIVKVVKNVYNDYWGYTSAGTYVKLGNLK